MPKPTDKHKLIRLGYYQSNVVIHSVNGTQSKSMCSQFSVPATHIETMKCDCDFILPTEEGWNEHYDNCKLIWAKKHLHKPYPRNEDGTFRILNDNLLKLDTDVLYHLGLDTKNYDLPAMFGDVKFICMGGTKERMKEFALYMHRELGLECRDDKPVNLTKHSHRFALYKIGPVISVNHGMGIPSMTILLQELIKLIHYARMRNPIIFRIGTSGGLGVPPGSVVVSSFGLNGTLEKSYDLPVLGKMRKYPALFDQRLVQEVLSLATVEDEYEIYAGGTMAADDFYRGQARLDGPFCDYTEKEKMAFLNTLTELGVKNIEMEATALAAITREAGISAGDVCVTLLDRLHGDQVTTSKHELTQWQKRPMEVVGKYIVNYCKNNPQ